jgi:RNA polymerase sigma-70 factor (ECF subfamily)
LSVRQIARAFLVSEDAMEQRLTRAKGHVKVAQLPFEAPDARDRSERLSAVSAALYLMFNEGYATTGGEAHLRVALCEEAIRMARLLLRLFPAEPALMGLLALMLLQHARAGARLDREGEIVLLEAQDRSLWDRACIQEGLALIDKAMRHRAPDPYQLQAAIASLHARAQRAEDTDWTQIERLYVVTLNRAVALAKVKGPEQALALIEPLAQQLGSYFYFFGVKGALLMQLGQREPARAAFNRAIALAHSAAEAAHIRMQLDRLSQAGRQE